MYVLYIFRREDGVGGRKFGCFTLLRKSNYFCCQPSNTKIIQRFQSKVLRTITNAPWYVSNYTLHNDLQIPFFTEEIKRYSTLYYNRPIGHEKSYVTELRNPINVRRVLKRQWLSDLKDQREEEE
jgi:hypothetical protein